MEARDYLARMSRVAAQISDAMTPAAVLETAARSVGEMLGARRAFVAVPSPGEASGVVLDLSGHAPALPWSGTLPPAVVGGSLPFVASGADVALLCRSLGIPSEGISGLVVLPMEELVGRGVLGFQFSDPDRLDETTLMIVQGLGACVERELRRTRVLEAERRARAEIELLFRLTRATNSAQFPGEVFEPALEAVTQALSVERASILLFDPDDVMRFKAWRGLSDAYRAAVEGHTPWARDAFDPPPLVIEDVLQDPSLAGYLATFQSEDIRALGFIPLVHKGTLLGKFMLYDRNPRAFSEHELRLAQTIAGLVAVTVVRTQLFEAEERHVEELAVLVEEQRRAVQARDEFLVVAGHELKTPLTALTLQTRLLARSVEGDAGSHSRAARISEVVRRMGRLVDELLDVSRLSTRKLALDRETVELGEVVRSVVAMMGQELEDARVDVRLVEEGCTRGRWDRLRLEQVVTNLLSNAVKFGHGRPVDVHVRGGAGGASLVVRDRGLGISDEDQARIFDKFERAVSSRHYGGLGVGLWVTREIIEAFGGTVGVTSTPGEGATFRIELPFDAPEQAEEDDDGDGPGAADAASSDSAISA